ncbi:MAG: hypothetical protein J7647_23605 [Cyanobacteria bacterium SBLK]|nr:hypothetical protein [Cyanobacteria bacterium SBLK]
MNSSKTVEAQISLPRELYHAIAQQAQANGQSFSQEIIKLLTRSLAEVPDDLEREFIAWETASDRDGLAMETLLASEDN